RHFAYSGIMRGPCQCCGAAKLKFRAGTSGVGPFRSESERESMKLNCPACGESFEDESDLGATLQLVEHLKKIPEIEHIAQLASMLPELERLIGQDESLIKATANPVVREVIFEKCARFDERLRTIQLFAVSTLTIAVEQTREMLQECGDFLGIR